MEINFETENLKNITIKNKKYKIIFKHIKN